MAKKGEKKHLKRLNAPKVRKGSKKTKKWAITSSPGPHPSDRSLPLSASLRENLKLVRNIREARKILSQGEVQVDGKARRDSRYSVGLMDVIEVPKTGKRWRVLFDKKGYLCFHEIGEDESQFKLARVANKTTFSGGNLQVSLHDGKTLVGDFEDFDLGDVVKIGLPDLEIQDRIPLKKDNLAMIIGGSNVGRTGRIREVLEVEGPSSNQIVIETDGEKFQSPEEYVFMIGRDEPEISLPGGD
ncbi:hypothetical protein AKJ55_00875 [candidate division MSBL1 archaeon SCGC-AAA382M17]|uniref:Small ribosomal subunit protein eS4 n=1 Tax=candidate division MSBL1 archaeon SCGC-AAA382M17 TaxID=1698284 RepID=A0ABR5TJN5_9EURY|nr:hypothetical protein AKJ55_00875 [candidate division MSBL1 archaeon SCGC-AAA382M17]